MIFCYFIPSLTVLFWNDNRRIRFETRNKKFETNLNDKNPNNSIVLNFGNPNFDILSDFLFQILDFLYEQAKTNENISG